jgi:hypothetical protein
MIKEIYIVLKHFDWNGYEIDSCWGSRPKANKRKKQLEKDIKQGSGSCDYVSISKEKLWDYSDE